MPGTRPPEAIESLVNKMAAQVEDGPCVTYIGLVDQVIWSTVHNGIVEQILAEAYDLMKRVKGMNGEQMADVLAQWNATEELSSYLVEITEVCLRTKVQRMAPIWWRKSWIRLVEGTPLDCRDGSSDRPITTIYASLNDRVEFNEQQRVAMNQSEGPSKRF